MDSTTPCWHQRFPYTVLKVRDGGRCQVGRFRCNSWKGMRDEAYEGACLFHLIGTRFPRHDSSKGRIVQGTHCPRDALSKGRIAQGAHRPRDASSKGYIVQWMHCKRDALSKGRIVQGTHRSREASLLAPLPRQNSKVGRVHLSSIYKISGRECAADSIKRENIASAGQRQLGARLAM
jgi:hypothetical protein